MESVEVTVVQSQGEACAALFDRIRQEKARSGRTTLQITQDTGVPKTTLDRFFAGTRSTLPFPYAAALCAYFGISMDAAVGLSPPESEDHAALLEKTEEQVELLRERSRMMEREIVSMRRSYNPLVFGLCGLCILLAVILMVYMVLDYQNPAQGLIRPGSVSLVPVLGVAAIVTFSLLLLHALVSRQFKKSKE